MSSEPLEIHEMQCRNSNCPPGTTRKHQVFVPLLLGPRHLENPCRRIEVGGSFRGKEPETGRSQFGSRRRAVKRIFWFLNGLREGPRIGPGSHSILRVKWDAGIGPGGLDWRGHGRPPWDSKDLTADQNRRLSEFYRRGGVNPPWSHGGLEVNFTLISLKLVGPYE